VFFKVFASEKGSSGASEDDLVSAPLRLMQVALIFLESSRFNCFVSVALSIIMSISWTGLILHV
jgi:hypothetical protein